MKKDYIYSAKKFKGFTVEKQGRILLAILKRIEKAQNDSADDAVLIRSYLNCLNFIESGSPGYSTFQEISGLFHDKRAFSNQLTMLRHKMQDKVSEDELFVLKRDGESVAQKSLPIVVILDNLRSAFNVGSIFRTSECIRVEKVYCCGITPLPDNKDMLSTTMGTADLVNWEHVFDTNEQINSLREMGYSVYALETAEPAADLFEFKPKLPLAIVLGNEALGISNDTLNHCDGILRIPVRGWKNSLNVAVSYAVAIYEIYRNIRSYDAE
jgi:tRNA G18 (ribose-2'-O)-methylase SpoU